MPAKQKHRKDEILQALAHLLEESQTDRITTAKLAKKVGVSEAALYRHFPSKARMFENLIEFIEHSILTRINRILDEEKDTAKRLKSILHLVLLFCQKNPGISRILIGDVIHGEKLRLHKRVVSLFNKLESQLKQVLRERILREDLLQEKKDTNFATYAANFLLCFIEGRLAQFARSEFKRLPTENFSQQWQVIEKTIL